MRLHSNVMDSTYCKGTEHSIIGWTHTLRLTKWGQVTKGLFGRCMKSRNSNDLRVTGFLLNSLNHSTIHSHCSILPSESRSALLTIARTSCMHLDPPQLNSLQPTKLHQFPILDWSNSSQLVVCPGNLPKSRTKIVDQPQNVMISTTTSNDNNQILSY